MTNDEVKGKLKKEVKIRVAEGKVTGKLGQVIKVEAKKVKGKIQEDFGSYLSFNFNFICK